MSDNKRNLFVSSRIRNFFVFYVLFSLLTATLFLGWEVFIEIIISSLPESSSTINPLRSFPTVIKVSLLLLWGMFSFLLSYTYLDAKFLGIFRRMDDLFKQMLQNESLSLKFRKHDSFDFLADSFNKMRQTFIDRIQRRKALVETLNSKIQALSDSASKTQIQEIIQEIDQELAQ